MRSRWAGFGSGACPASCSDFTAAAGASPPPAISAAQQAHMLYAMAASEANGESGCRGCGLTASASSACCQFRGCAGLRALGLQEIEQDPGIEIPCRYRACGHGARHVCGRERGTCRHRVDSLNVCACYGPQRRCTLRPPKHPVSIHVVCTWRPEHLRMYRVRCLSGLARPRSDCARCCRALSTARVR